MGSGDYNPPHSKSSQCQTSTIPPAARPDCNNSYNQNFIITIYGEIYGQEEEISFNSYSRYEIQNMRWEIIISYHTDSRYLVPSFHLIRFRFVFQSIDQEFFTKFNQQAKLCIYIHSISIYENTIRCDTTIQYNAI